MRIISGKYKGRKLEVLAGSDMRPTLDRVKVRLFDILNFSLSNAAILDVFCGSGSLGLEALSRNASFATFIEKDQNAAKLLEKNLAKLGCANANVICGDFFSALQNLKNKYNIVFIDPPYDSNYYASVMQQLIDKKLLFEDALVVCEHSRLLTITPPAGYRLKDRRDIGTVSLSFFVFSCLEEEKI